MATNQSRPDGRHLRLPVPTGYVSGNPVAVGALPGVLVDTRDAAGYASVDTRGAYNLAVSATGAISAGDIVYLATYLGAPVLSNINTGVRFGYALAAVGNGLTATIEVRIGY